MMNPELCQNEHLKVVNDIVQRQCEIGAITQVTPLLRPTNKYSVTTAAALCVASNDSLVVGIAYAKSTSKVSHTKYGPSALRKRTYSQRTLPCSHCLPRRIFCDARISSNTTRFAAKPQFATFISQKAPAWADCSRIIAVIS